MWRLIERRLRPQWWILPTVLICAALSSASLFAFIPNLLLTTDHVVAVVGFFALSFLWLGQRITLAFDHGERRDTLLSLLPLPHSQVAWARSLAVLVLPLGLGLLLLLSGAVGRLFGDGDGEPVLGWFLLVVTALVTLSDQFHLLWNELSTRRFVSNGFRIVAFSLCVMVFGVLIAAFFSPNSLAFLLNRGGSLQNLHTSLGFALACFGLTLVLAALNQLLFRRRPDYTV